MKKLIIRFDLKYKELLSIPEQIQKAYDVVNEFNNGEQSLEIKTGSDFFVAAINHCIVIFSVPHKQNDYPLMPMLDPKLVQAFDCDIEQVVEDKGIDFDSVDRLIDNQNRISDDLYYELIHSKDETI